MTDLVYRHISEEQVGQLEKAIGSVPRIRELLQKFLAGQSNNQEEDESAVSAQRNEILVDLYFYCYTFTKDNLFSPKKIGCMLSLMKELLLNDIEAGMRSVARCRCHQ